MKHYLKDEMKNQVGKDIYTHTFVQKCEEKEPNRTGHINLGEIL